jgi:class 3 adenylate cyclase
MVDLPVGAVTFLFTDIEGSTRLLGQHPEVYRAAVRRHHDLLTEAVEAHEGVVFETVGDAVYASFARPTDALKAALQGQMALQAEPWVDTPIKIRMGMHHGEVEVQGAHYFGVPLYRCARLMSTAHGGQVVLSEIMAGLVRDALPEGATLTDLGEHRLQDLGGPTSNRVTSRLPPLKA